MLDEALALAQLAITRDIAVRAHAVGGDDGTAEGAEIGDGVAARPDAGLGDAGILVVDRDPALLVDAGRAEYRLRQEGQRIHGVGQRGNGRYQRGQQSHSK